MHKEVIADRATREHHGIQIDARARGPNPPDDPERRRLRDRPGKLRSRQWLSGVLAAVTVTVGLSGDSTLTAAMALTSTEAPTPEPADAFFVPPDVLPAGAPGDVIRARASAAGPPSARALADAWQVMYLSTSATGAPVAVTGTVLVPRGVDRAGAPVIGLAPGTHGPALRCAPSSMIAMGASTSSRH